ncbi:MAG: 23S rRNA (pseudouridine(1915)-N(3))-methyltransferase RlmH [Flavobacteriaceae bacterium]|nr:23S rRNA (pseudouridine(1915)-N(3))-methyltransferase RlmH [Flavobacteriaceae bacterium]|tara:strand:- start:358 stop:831 length:474 start_codon:yes stop_codon:yes gene_type:complete
MKIKLLVIGKTTNKSLTEIIKKYENRLIKYISFSQEIIPSIKKTKKLSENIIKQKEAKMILNKVAKNDCIFLLDQSGISLSSFEFSRLLQKQINNRTKQLVFVIGGAYGVSDEIKNLVDKKISFSKMTFSHQMIRLFAIEQIYRGFTILNNEPYHHK